MLVSSFISQRTRSLRIYCVLSLIATFILWPSIGFWEQRLHVEPLDQPAHQYPSEQKSDFTIGHGFPRVKSNSERQIYVAHTPVSIPAQQPQIFSTSPKHEGISPRNPHEGNPPNQGIALVEDDVNHIDSQPEIHKDDSIKHAPYLLHKNDDEADSILKKSLKVTHTGENGPKRKVESTATKHSASKDKNGSSSQSRHADDGLSEAEADYTQEPVRALNATAPISANYSFPAWRECENVKERADTLPDMLFIPFEQSVHDVLLQGWEDDWVSKGEYTGPKLQEPRIDFVYNWINGSQPELKDTMHPYELNSTLNDPEGVWVASHGTNRYREWDELRYSMRSVEKYAGSFINRIQILVNSFYESGQSRMNKQRPVWLKSSNKVQVVSQEEFFGPEERKCLPSFDSLTIENQLYNTNSETDRLFALSDDMILGKPHAASDLYSPLFGATMGFKDNAYNTLKPPTQADADRFGEKPFLIYTSWLLNRRFGARKRKGQVHFGHSLSRNIAKEAITSFPRPALRSAYQRFRGETGFQLYSWYGMFHYTMERHREVLLWSYIMLRSDADNDGYLDWNERKEILREVAEGMSNDPPEQFRDRMFYRVSESLQKAGIQPPKVNTETLWTAMDGPMMIKGLECDAFDTEDCLAPGFSMAASDATAKNPVFSSAAIFDRVAREIPHCGDCLIKLLLNRKRAGLGPLLPHAVKKPKQREVVVKALMKYQYTIIQPDASFYMVTDAEQIEHSLLKPYLKHGKKVGQICLNDDVATDDEEELEKLRKAMSTLFHGLLPEPSSFEK